MQAYIMRYVERLQERIAATDCSIATALEVELREYDRLTLIKIRDAAIDLQRIVELEVGRREEVATR